MPWTGIGFAVSQVLGQITGGIIKNHFPSKMELERHEMDKSRFEISLKELETRERHFLMQMAQTRENLILQIDAQRDNLEYQKLLERWPLNLSPIAILKESKKRDSCALTVIVNLVDTNDQGFYAGRGQTVSRTIDMIRGRPFDIADRAASLFGHDMVCYCEARKNAGFAGDSLRTTLSCLLESEPTVLIEVRVGQEPDTETVDFHVCHWGWPGDSHSSYTKYPPHIFRLLPLPPPLLATDSTEIKQRYSEIEHLRKLGVSLVLAGLIVSIGDVFRTLQCTQNLPTPVLPSIMSDPTFGMLPIRDAKAQVPQEIYTVLQNVYLSNYDGVGRLNRLLGSELAAKAAITAHEAGQQKFASDLLDKAFALAGSDPSLATFSSILRDRRDKRTKPSELERAAIEMRGWSPGEEEPPHSVDEIIRRFGRIN